MYYLRNELILSNIQIWKYNYFTILKNKIHKIKHSLDNDILYGITWYILYVIKVTLKRRVTCELGSQEIHS